MAKRLSQKIVEKKKNRHRFWCRGPLCPSHRRIIHPSSSTGKKFSFIVCHRPFESVALSPRAQPPLFSTNWEEFNHHFTGIHSLGSLSRFGRWRHSFSLGWAFHETERRSFSIFSSSFISRSSRTFLQTRFLGTCSRVQCSKQVLLPCRECNNIP